VERRKKIKKVLNNSKYVWCRICVTCFVFSYHLCSSWNIFCSTI